MEEGFHKKAIEMDQELREDAGKLAIIYDKELAKTNKSTEKRSKVFWMLIHGLVLGVLEVSIFLIDWSYNGLFIAVCMIIPIFYLVIVDYQATLNRSNTELRGWRRDAMAKIHPPCIVQ